MRNNKSGASCDLRGRCDRRDLQHWEMWPALPRNALLMVGRVLEIHFALLQRFSVSLFSAPGRPRALIPAHAGILTHIFERRFLYRLIAFKRVGSIFHKWIPRPFQACRRWAGAVHLRRFFIARTFCNKAGSATTTTGSKKCCAVAWARKVNELVLFFLLSARSHLLTLSCAESSYTESLFFSCGKQI